MRQQLKLRGLLALALILGACSEDEPGTEDNPGPIITTPDSSAPAPSTPDAGSPGVTNPTPTTPDSSTTPLNPIPRPDGGAADTGALQPVDSGNNNNKPDTSVPTPEAGPSEGGTSNDAGDAGPVTPGSGDGYIRGPDPTEQSILRNGPYAVKSYTSGFQRASGVDSSTVWYPDSPEAKPPFAGIAVVPGFVSPEASIREWGPFLASYGIVTVTIGVPGGDQPNARATKLLGTLESLKKENTRSGSPLMGKIDENRLAVSGWSMGGGGTLIASSRTPTLKACMSFAAWGPTGGRNNKVPCLMFEATADILAASMSDGFYRDVPATTPKMLFEVQGSSHNVANSPKNHNNIIGAYGLSWMKVFLEGDERYRKFLLRPFPSICTSKSAHNLK